MSAAVHEIEQTLRQVAERKPTHETIADQATSIVARANATILDEIETTHRELDELRGIQVAKAQAAEEAIRDAMHVCGEVGKTTAHIRSQIAEFRAASARSV